MLCLLLITAQSAYSQGGPGPGLVPPCTAGIAGENIIPIHTPDMTYCVSDYGWSDTWLIPASTVYDPAMDALSGDDAANLHFNIGGVPSAGNGWLSPGLDAGALMVSYATGSPWVVVVPVDWIGGGPTGTSITQSVIHHPAFGIDIRITTSAFDTVMNQTYDIFNNGTFMLEDLVLADYFNYHPNGSTAGAATTGTVEYSAGTLSFTGGPGGGALSDATLFGAFIDSAHAVGTPGGVIAMTETMTLDGSAGQLGPGDVAGTLAWELGDLTPGSMVSFTLTKTIPEPASLYMLAFGAVLMAHRRRATL
jgi:hypothetical protein